MRNFDRLFRPSSIAVIGGGSWSVNLFNENKKIGYTGTLWSVHPTKSSIAGYQSFSSIQDLPGVPDVAYVAVNRKTSVKVVAELADLGCGGAICFASGFLESINELSDGGNLQQELIDAAGAMPLLGPNCYGFINAIEGVALWPDQHGLVRVDKGVAIISQSSNIAINLTMQKRGLPIAYMITIGNQAQVGISELASAMLKDSRVTTVGLYIEGIDDLEDFQNLAKLAEMEEKQIVVIRVGKSQEAKLATISHTASIAGTEAGSTALMKRLGFTKVGSLEEFLEVLKLFHVFGTNFGNQIVSMSCSGGEAGLVADKIFDRQLVLPKLTKQQQTELRKVLGPEVTLANPLDYHTQIWSNIEAMTQTFTIMLSGDCDLGLVILDFPRQDRCLNSEWMKVITAVVEAKKNTGKRIAIVSTMAENMPEAVAIEIMSQGVVPLAGLNDAVRAIEAIAEVSRKERIQKIFIPKKLKNFKRLSEFEAKSEIKNYKVKIPKGFIANSAEEALNLARKLNFPIVLKGDNISHKTESGAVVLNIEHQNDLLDATQKIKTEKFLVEEMIGDVIAELLIGIVYDPAHGYVLTFAPGGIYTELYRESFFLMVPFNKSDIKKALASMKFAKILSGFRGKPSCNLKMIIDTMLAMQEYVLSNSIAEVEINPLLCGEDFAIAGDVLVQLGEFDG